MFETVGTKWLNLNIRQLADIQIKPFQGFNTSTYNANILVAF